jgi:hypothetical protein
MLATSSTPNPDAAGWSVKVAHSHVKRRPEQE